jgi:hypothetical protein
VKEVDRVDSGNGAEEGGQGGEGDGVKLGGWYMYLVRRRGALWVP